MYYKAKPSDGKVTPNGEIIYKDGKYYVNDEVFSDYIKITDDFAEAVVAYEEYCAYLSVQK